MALLLTGLLGAVIGALALLAAQGWQLWLANRNAKAAARLIYLEIAYNLSILKTVSTSSAPIPLLVATSLWDHHSDKLVAVMHEREIAHVAFAYVQVETYRWFFSQPWYYLAVNRIKGDDVTLIGRLSEAFAAAEAALRPKVWTGSRLSALGDAMRTHSEAIPKPTISHRLSAAFRQVPVEFLSAIAVVLLILERTLKLRDTLRGRKAKD